MKRVTLLDNGRSKLWVIKDYCKDLLTDSQSLALLHEPPIMVRGKLGKQNRNVGFFSDESDGYHYSNQKMAAQSLPPFLSDMMTRVNHDLDSKFNGVLVNEYVNGSHYIGAHSDDERTLDKKSKLVVSIAFGATRDFRVRDRKTGKVVLTVVHNPCTLLAMEGDFQQDFTHEIPKQLKVNTKRISYTFRSHLKDKRKADSLLSHIEKKVKV